MPTRTQKSQIGTMHDDWIDRHNAEINNFAKNTPTHQIYNNEMISSNHCHLYGLYYYYDIDICYINAL